MMINNSCHRKGDRSIAEKNDSFFITVDRFADIKILRYQVPGFDELSLNQKKQLYYLSQAALWGRDILFDQFYKHNLLIRKTLETIYTSYQGDRTTDDYNAFVVYLKRVWFSSGIHHHYSTEKFIPGFSRDYFRQLIRNSAFSWLKKGDTPELLAEKLIPVMFDMTVDTKRVNLDHSKDLIASSATNFYSGVTEHEATVFYEALENEHQGPPLEYGLNTQLVKENGKLVEKVWRSGGMYGQAIDSIVYWLGKAAEVAEDEQQKKMILQLIRYYETGDLKTWFDYTIQWVNDNSKVDFVNGFVEVYGDPLARKGTWESAVNFRDEVATARTRLLASNAQWFEDHSPVDPRFKKEKSQGVSAKAITIVQLAGDCYPHSPIGINLPNNEWVRSNHGSKSVTLTNIIHSQYVASFNDGLIEEFAFSEQEVERARKYGALALDLHVDMHECLGHASGKMLEHVTAGDLKNYHSTIEETRADLFALYYIMDQKLIDLGLIPSFEVAYAEYDSYIRSGLLVQLTRIESGKEIEESHMRNRQLIASWLFEKGLKDNVIEKIIKDGKTFFKINNYKKMHENIGILLAEIQRVKSEGDIEQARYLVEKYGVKVDSALHCEVLERFKKLKIAPYTGFINPLLIPVMDDGEIIDIRIEYPTDYAEQMLFYSTKYAACWNY